MSCESCTVAEKNPFTGRYAANCDNCKARALANGRELHASKAAGYTTPEYLAALVKVFGEDRTKEGHALVREWSKKIKNHTKGSA